MVDVYYPDSVIAQRWNDVLAVRNDDFNGGYEFVAYQWYKDNMPIDGATSSILYGDLDFDAEYSVMLTRNDGVKEMVCAIKPIQFTDMAGDPILIFTPDVSSDVVVKVAKSAQVRVWSTTGLLVGEYSIEEGENALNMESLQGVYLLEFIFVDGNHVVERVVF
jgi:hypothetical protein